MREVTADAFDIWLAGFIDGDGSICISKAGDYKFIYVSIAQHERARHVLDDIQARYGGSISRKCGRDGFGHNMDQRSILRLDIRSQSQVVELLRAVQPHLRIKQAKAADALAAIGEPIRSWRWTERDVAHLRKRYGRCDVEEVASDLDRTVAAVYRKARAVGLRA